MRNLAAPLPREGGCAFLVGLQRTFLELPKGPASYAVVPVIPHHPETSRGLSVDDRELSLPFQEQLWDPTA